MMKKSMRVVITCIIVLVVMFSAVGCGDNYDEPVKVEGESVFIDHSKTIGDYLMMIPMYGDTYRNDNFCYTLLNGDNSFGWITAVDFDDKNWNTNADEEISKMLQTDDNKLSLIESGILMGAGDWYAYSISNAENNAVIGYYIIFGQNESQYAYVLCADASYVDKYGYTNLINSCIFNESSFKDYAYKNIEYHIEKYKEDQK